MTQKGVEKPLVSPLFALGEDSILKNMNKRMLTTDSPEVAQLIRDRSEILIQRKRMDYHKVNPHRPFADIMPDGAWAGERCFVVGGGPSLEGFDFERLRGKGKIIVINKSFLDVPFADILFFMDGSKTTFYGLVHRGKLAPDALDKWKEFKGHKVYMNLVGRQFDDVYSVRALGRAGVSTSIKHGLYYGNNSGVGAIGLAICLRANPIYLLGIDCKYKDGKSHYHSGYFDKKPEWAYRGFTKDFARMNRVISRTKYKVINLNPDSGLRCFPFSTIDEVLKNDKTR